MKRVLIPIVVALTVLVSQVVTEVSAQTPEPSQDLRPALIYVNGDADALAAVCEIVAAGGTVEGVVYDCSAFPAFQIVCTDPQRATVDCFPDATPVPDTCWDCKTPSPEPTPIVVPTPEATETVVAP